MPDIIFSIESDFSHAVVERCEDKGCILRLDGLKNYVALKGELITPQKKICDNIIFEQNKQVIVSVVELKGKKPSLSEVKKQLEKGRNIALDILGKYNVNIATSGFYFIVLAVTGTATQKKKEQQEKKKKKELYIEVAGRKYDIIRKRCGTTLCDIMRS